MCISPTQNESEQKNNSNNDDSDDDNSTAIARLITRAATTSITAYFFQTMGLLGWNELLQPCRFNAAGLEFWSWSSELQRCVRVTYDYLLEELLIEDDCQRCQRKFWRQMRFAFLWCPTCRRSWADAVPAPEAEADPKWQCTRRWSWSWACRACNTENWPSRIRCRACTTPKSLEPAWLSKQREDLRQKECARIAPLTIASCEGAPRAQHRQRTSLAMGYRVYI